MSGRTTTIPRAQHTMTAAARLRNRFAWAEIWMYFHGLDILWKDLPGLVDEIAKVQRVM